MVQVVSSPSLVVTVPTLKLDYSGACIFQQNMRYQIRERWFSMSGDCIIKDMNGFDAFRLKGEPFSWGLQISFKDAYSGNQVAYIHQKLRLGMPHFELYRSGKHYATIKKQFSLLESKFEVDMVNPQNGQDLSIRGDWYGYDFEIYRGNRRVASVNKKFFTMTDVYGVEIVAGEDNVLLLATAVIIEKCSHDHQHHHRQTYGVGLGTAVVFGNYHNHHNHHRHHYGHHHGHHRHGW